MKRRLIANIIVVFLVILLTPFIEIKGFTIEQRINSPQTYFTDSSRLTINNLGAPIYQYYGIFVEDYRAYLREDGFKVLDVSNPRKPSMIGRVNSNSYFCTIQAGLLTELFFNTDETGIIRVGMKQTDIQNIANPVELTQWLIDIELDSSYYEITLEDNFVYLLKFDEIYDEKSTISLRVIDFSNQTNPKITEAVFINDYSIDSLFATQIKDKRLYVLQDDYRVDNDEKLEIFDLSNTASPQKIAEYECPGKELLGSIIIREQLIYLLFSDFGFEVINQSNPSNPVKVTEFQIDDYCTQLIFSENLAYLISYKGINILDISNPGEIKKKGRYYARGQGNGGFLLGVIENGFVYLLRRSEHKDRMFFIIDCSNPNFPKKVYPSGIRLSAETTFGIYVCSIWFGILGSPVIIVSVIIFIIVRITKRRKQKQFENLTIKQELAENESENKRE